MFDADSASTDKYASKAVAVQVFQLQQISVDADFFRIGGNSLLAGKIISRLRSAFSIELPFTSIFQHRTIADMALFIQSKLQQNPSSKGGAQTSDEIVIPKCALACASLPLKAQSCPNLADSALAHTIAPDPCNQAKKASCFIIAKPATGLLALCKAVSL